MYPVVTGFAPTERSAPLRLFSDETPKRKTPNCPIKSKLFRPMRRRAVPQSTTSGLSDSFPCFPLVHGR